MIQGKPGAATKLIQAASLTVIVINRYKQHLTWQQQLAIRGATRMILKVAAELHGAQAEPETEHEPEHENENTEQGAEHAATAHKKTP